MCRLEGKVAIITGASGTGIGRAIATLFAKEGAEVVIAGRGVEGGEETVRMVKEAGGKAIFIKTDVAKAEDVKKMVKAAVDTYGKLDVLVNNAAITEPEGSTVDLTEELFDRTIAINLKGVWLGMKYAIPEMLKTGGGSIINFASQAANRALPTIPAYSASKGGVISLSRVAALEFASKNIRVNCISPGPIATRMVIDEWPPEQIEHFSKVIPRGRLGKPEEVAQVAVFLASDESSWITLQTLVVDGGLSERIP